MAKPAWLPFWLGCLGVLLTGCSSRPVPDQAYSDLPSRAEVAGVPYFPQEEDQCGPASLATLLVHRGIEVTPDALRPQIYLPGKGGTLAVELVARARRYGLLAYPLAPSLPGLLSELSAGNPVLVMQNLRFDWWPKWHFAVAIGYDLAQGTLLLRSGPEVRYAVPLGLFERTWRRADHWAVVVMPPAQLPASAEPLPWLRAAGELERVGQTAAARQAYGAALGRWPQQPLALMGLGNSAYTLGDYPLAREHFRQALEQRPQWPAAWNNFAYALANSGCPTGAAQAIACARTLAPASDTFRDSQQALGKLAGGQSADPACTVPACPAP